MTPSWVSFTNDARSIGDAAKNAYHTYPENTVFDAKRLIGRKSDNPEIKRDMKHWTFKVSGKVVKPSIQVKHEGDLKDSVSDYSSFSFSPSLIAHVDS